MNEKTLFTRSAAFGSFALNRLGALFLVIACLFTGCRVGPDYRRPEVEVPKAWRLDEKEARDLVNTPWWEQFKDPVLNALILEALKGNRDVRIASARVEEFMGRYGVTRSALFPRVGATGEAGRQRVSRVSGPVPLSSQVDPTYDAYAVYLSAGWELDVWGKLRNAKEAARADFLATEEGRRGVVLTLVTSLARAYVTLRDLDKELEISRRTAKTRQDSYQLFQLRFNGGLISELQLSQVKSEYEAALATIPQLEKTIALQENLICSLLGKNPGPIPRGKTIDALSLPLVPAGLPSHLLEQRPDIRQAEQDLISANARIGVARASYFPTISLTGALGTASAGLSDLFTGPSRAWNYTAPVTAPIFTAGAIKGEVKAAEAVRRQALFRYEKAVQNGFREVNDALVDQNRTRAQLEAQLRQIEALRDYARLALLRYENGYSSYVEVLDAERSLFDAELRYTQAQNQLFQALVNLYKAMGGGWVVEADKISEAASPRP